MGAGVFIIKRDWSTLESLNLSSLSLGKKLVLPVALILTLCVQYLGKPSKVNKHLLFSMFSGLGPSMEKAAEFKKIPYRDVFKLKFGTPTVAENIDFASLKKKLKRKNIVFIVIESVGTMQIFEGQKLIADHLPFLASKQNETFSFTTIHDNFPGTTRSHLPIMIGGETLTWGSVSKELLYPFKGPTLASEFKNLEKKLQ